MFADFECYTEENAMHIVMELCNGGDVDQYLRARHGRSMDEACWHLQH